MLVAPQDIGWSRALSRPSPPWPKSRAPIRAPPTPSAQPSAEPTPEATPEATPEGGLRRNRRLSPRLSPLTGAHHPGADRRTYGRAHPGAHPYARTYDPNDPHGGRMTTSRWSGYTSTAQDGSRGEAVQIFVNDHVGSSWSHTATVTADAFGTLLYEFSLPRGFVVTYTVTATGSQSGLRPYVCGFDRRRRTQHEFQ